MCVYLMFRIYTDEGTVDVSYNDDNYKPYKPLLAVANITFGRGRRTRQMCTVTLCS